MSPMVVALWCVVTAPAVLLAVAGWRARSDIDEGIAHACHELRGPITAARLGLQLGARTGELSPERLRAIDQELGRAGLALEDLTLSRGRPRRLGAVDTVDVGDLLRDSVEALRPAAQASQTSVRLLAGGQRARVWGDRLRLAQVTGNLIANAIEHGGGAIDVKQVTERERVRIEVVDDGPGLRASVAELARRARRRDCRRGRGLAIASAIAAEHHGRLSAAPSERGARLVLELPLARTAQQPTGQEPEASA
ncbi:MAG: HAMP domain-containing histidine kinase [Actinomycetota bacterium]|nr:HAMP domain-containing histidine kinase [Actinomycetota bacterium]